MSIELRIALAVIGLLGLVILKWWQPGQQVHVDGRVYRVHERKGRRTKRIVSVEIALPTKSAARFTATAVDDVSSRLGAAGIIKRPLTGDADFDARVFVGGDDAFIALLTRDAGLRAVVAHLVNRGRLSADGREVRYVCSADHRDRDDDFHGVAAIDDAIDAAIDAAITPATPLRRFVGVDTAFQAFVGVGIVYGVGGIAAWLGGRPQIFFDTTAIAVACVGVVFVVAVVTALVLLLASRWSAQLSRLVVRRPVELGLAVVLGGTILAVDINQAFDGPAVDVAVRIDSVDVEVVKKRRGKTRQRHSVTLHVVNAVDGAPVVPTQVEINETMADRLSSDTDAIATIGRGALGASYWIDLR